MPSGNRTVCSVRQTKRKQIVENEHRHTRQRFKSTQILYLQISSDWSSVLLCGYYSCNTSSLVSWYSQQRIVITFPFFFQVFGQLQVSYCRMMTSGSPVNQMPLASMVQWRDNTKLHLKPFAGKGPLSVDHSLVQESQSSSQFLSYILNDFVKLLVRQLS